MACAGAKGSVEEGFGDQAVESRGDEEKKAEAEALRFLFVWLVLIASLFVATTGWYLLSPTYVFFMDSLNTLVGGLPLDAGQQNTWSLIYNFARHTWQWLPVILIGGFLAWAVLASVKREYESYAWGE